jgi:hypothetical protein
MQVRHASQSEADAAPVGTHAMVGRQLRDAVEAELATLRSRIAGLGGGAETDTTWLRQLSDEETAFVNLGQVPGVDGSEIITLIDLDLRAVPFTDAQKAGPEGKGVHVPLLAHVGTTDPAVPCYPVNELFGGRGSHVAGLVKDVLGAQLARKNAGSAESQVKSGLPLVAVVVPAKGEQRDLALPLAISLYRLAMHEGNGHTEGTAADAQ